MRIAKDVQRALARRCGDRSIRRAHLARNRALVFGELREDSGEKP